MKLTTILFFTYIALTTTIVKAEKSFGLFKPVVNLNKRIISTTTPKLPAERRKLPIFPKNPTKYVVTSKPYSKVRVYAPRTFIPQKKHVVTKIKTYSDNVLSVQPVTVIPLFSSFDITLEAPVEQVPLPVTTTQVIENTKNSDFDETKIIPKQDNRLKIKNTADDGNDVGLNLQDSLVEQVPPQVTNEELADNKNSDLNDINPGQDNTLQRKNTTADDNDVGLDIQDSEETSTDLTEIDMMDLNDIENIQRDSNLLSDLDEVRIKRLTIDSPLNNNWTIKAHIPSDDSHEMSDKQEFIFVNDNWKKSLSDLLFKTTPSENIEALPEIPKEYHIEDNQRLKRSDNIIEEENTGSTVSEFKFTGREPRLSNNLAFKNIHV